MTRQSNLFPPRQPLESPRISPSGGSLWSGRLYLMQTRFLSVLICWYWCWWAYQWWTPVGGQATKLCWNFQFFLPCFRSHNRTSHKNSKWPYLVIFVVWICGVLEMLSWTGWEKYLNIWIYVVWKFHYALERLRNWLAPLGAYKPLQQKVCLQYSEQPNF